MIMYENFSPNYTATMRNSVITATDLLESIERDIVESRQLIRAKNTDESITAQLMSTLQEDNAILMVGSSSPD